MFVDMTGSWECPRDSGKNVMLCTVSILSVNIWSPMLSSICNSKEN